MLIFVILIWLEENMESSAAISSTTYLPGPEKGFSATKFGLVALAVAGVACGAFFVWPPAMVGLIVVAGWFAWSAIIVLLNRHVNESSPLATPIQRLHAFAMEIYGVMLCVLFFPMTFFECSHRPQKEAKGPPILLVNGWASFGATWYPLRKRLEKQGFDRMYSMNVGSGKSIVTYAEELQKKATEIANESGRSDLTLICHSKGGLVGAYFASHLAKEKNVKVITIGSPFKGTPLGHLRAGFDVAEMRSDSDFTRGLREAMKTSGKQFYHIASEADLVVSKESALVGEDKGNHYVVKDIGHLSLIFSSRVATKIATWLKASPQ